MIIKILFGQMKESYAEQYAPEALCCVDEYTDEDNPEFFEKECEKVIKLYGRDYVSSKIIEIEVNQDKIRELFLNNPKIDGYIK